MYVIPIGPSSLTRFLDERKKMISLKRMNQGMELNNRRRPNQTVTVKR